MAFFDGLKRFFLGSKGGFSQQNLLNPQQQQLHGDFLSQFGGAQNQGLDYIMSLLNGGDQAFQDFEDPYKRQFEQETIPGLAERFAGLGSHGAQNSSAFQQTLGQAGGELSQNLAQLRGGLKNNALSALQGMQGQAYQPTFQTSYRQPTGGLLGGLSGGLSQGLGSYLGAGAFGGGGIAELLKSLMGGGSGSTSATGSAQV